MQAFKLQSFVLKDKNPAQSDDYDLTITGTVEDKSTHLAIDYAVKGAIANIKWPRFDGKGQRQDHLWEHTCCEIFVAAYGERHYCEYNLSPSSQWNAYIFKDYRQFQKDLPIDSISISCIPSPPQKQLNLAAMVPLPNNLHNVSLDIGISTVIEMTRGGFFYFALTHCSTKPDFHIRESFILHLER